MSDLVDPRLSRYVVEAHFHLVPDPDAFVFGDGEMQFFVRRRDEVYEVTEVQRGSSEPVWTTSARSAVDRWLVKRLVGDWRDRHDLPWPFLPTHVEDSPETVVVHTTDRGLHGLSWSEGGQPCYAEGLNAFDAVAVAHLLQWSMDDILAAFERRNTEPVFSRVLWSKRPRRGSRRG